jgi:putative tryptophan/tyrosine transport system substrate-binding protein
MGSALALPAVWPTTAHAQGKVFKVGALIIGNADAESFRTELRNEMQKLGYTEGRNVTYDIRSAEEKLDRLPGLAAELVAKKVDVIVALYTPCGLAAKAATRDIPVVVITGDPVGTGIVPSLSHPGGNITGISLIAAALHGKCVEFFRDMLPGVKRVAALVNAADPFWVPFLEQVQLAGKGTGMEIAPVSRINSPGEIEAAFDAIKKASAGAVVVQGSSASKNTANLAMKYGLPAASISRSFAEAGGLMSYGADAPDSFRRSAVFVNKILQGSKPADMPVEQATKFELVVNLKTAKVFGLTISESFLLRADTVIE